MRCHSRKKNGKLHRYWSVVESRRVGRGEPGSELAVHARWFERSAMDELSGTDFAVAAKDRLYRCLDRILAHKDDLCRQPGNVRLHLGPGRLACRPGT